MIDNIVGLASLPVGILLFLNVYGFTNVESIFGIDILLIAAITLIIIQISNIVGSHLQDHNMVMAYSIHLFMIYPSVMFFASKLISIPQVFTTSLPIVFASFIFIEGLYSFFF